MTLDAEQVLQIAMELEEAGEVCYEVLGTVAGRDGQPVPSFLAESAEDERKHYETFRRMLQELRARKKTPPRMLTDEQRAQFPRLMPSGVLPDVYAMRAQAGTMSIRDALAMTVAGERDAIAFYQRILLMLTDKEDAAAIQQIIDEEKTHEAELMSRFARMCEHQAD